MEHACVAWEGAPVDDPRALAMALDAVDVSGDLVVLAADVLVSQRHLAAGVAMASRRWARDRAVGRTLGAELMRCLAGSHHIGEAIKAVGLPKGATSGWLVGLGVEQGDLERLMRTFGFEACAPHSMTEQGRARLGLPHEGDLEHLALGLVAQADLLA
ncbi:MAG: KEOPS complex subunit Cgi121 [Candidatus Poseidoniaceae archaeon]